MWTTKNMPDITGKTAIVTGANTGIGFETALALYQAGANVVLACRSLENARQAMVKIKESKGKGKTEIGLLDLTSMDRVKQFAETFFKEHQQLHLLINNGGVMVSPASKTTEGYELQFGVNFLGHFALTGHLYPLLRSTPGARVVTLTSMGYLRGSIDFDNLKSEKDYDPLREYCQSKLADLLFAVELQRRIAAANDRVISVGAQPGANKTSWLKDISKEQLAAAEERWGGPAMEPWQGALSSLFAAVNEDVVGGRLYEPGQDGGYRGFPAESTIAPNALDEAVARKLWDFAEQATGINFLM